MDLPEAYAPATWRNTTAVDRERSQVGIGFRVGSDRILRLRLSLDDCRMLAEALAESLELAIGPAPTPRGRTAPLP